MAHRRLKLQGRPDALNTTSLVHESYLRFANAGQLSIDDRTHFYRYAGHVMRSVIVDLARASLRERRGGGARPVTLITEQVENLVGGEEEILKIHEALDELAAFDPRLVEVVEMRYFVGLTEREIAEILGVTDRTVRRDWEKARLLLARAIG